MKDSLFGLMRGLDQLALLGFHQLFALVLDLTLYGGLSPFEFLFEFLAGRELDGFWGVEVLEHPHLMLIDIAIRLLTGFPLVLRLPDVHVPLFDQGCLDPLDQLGERINHIIEYPIHDGRDCPIILDL